MPNSEVGSAYVSIMPSMKGFNTELTSKLGSAFKSVGKVAAASFAAASAATIAVGKQSLDAYANFEQLSGGVQKIFDEMDYAQIEADAQAAYKNMGMSANQYMEAMTSTGATFAQTMGDQKGYDMAKEGLQSLADYASGTGKDMDLLTEKFSLITRSTSSYQSIADQFAGVLPGTSAAFLEQAQAAGFLSDAYTSLTEVPMDEYQAAVTQMITKGVDDMGLLGNTYAEAETTVSGSLAAMQSSWQNWLTELGKSDGDMSRATDELLQSVETAGGNVANVIQSIIENAVAALPQVISTVGAKLRELMPQELGGLVDSFMSVFDSGAMQVQLGQFVEAFENLRDSIMPFIEAIGPIVGKVAGGIVASLIVIAKEVMNMVSGVIKGITGLINGFKSIPKVVSSICKAAVVLFNGFKANVARVWTQIKSTVITVANGIKSGVIGAWNALKGSISSVINGIKSTVVGTWNNIKSSVMGVVNGIKSSITGAFSGIAGSVRAKFNAVKEAITSPITSAKKTLSDIVSKIKGIFPINLGKIMKLKIPKISIDGGKAPWGIGGKGTKPSFSVSWAAKGGFVDGATLIGAGEAGTEMILPKSGRLMNQFADTITSKMHDGAPAVYVNGTVNDTPQIRAVTKSYLLELARLGAI